MPSSSASTRRGNPIPELVTTIPTKANRGISADGRTITWHLRHGVRWSDGAPFSADDVTYTFRVAMDRDNNIPVRAPWERLAAVTAPDRYTVVFHFKAPYALFLADYFSTLSSTCVLPKHVLGPGTKINQAPFNALPVGIGPFRYTAFNRGNDVELEANPYYWRGHAKLQRIVYKMITEENTDFTELQTGELDLWALINGRSRSAFARCPGIAVAAAPGGIMSGLYFNTHRPAVTRSARAAGAALCHRPSNDGEQDRARQRTGAAVRWSRRSQKIIWRCRRCRTTPNARRRCSTRPAGDAEPDGVRQQERRSAHRSTSRSPAATRPSANAANSCTRTGERSA